MGTWTDKTEENIAESDDGGSPGDGVASEWRYPEPGEGFQFDVVRTDAATYSDPWLAALQVSADPANNVIWLRVLRFASGSKWCTFPVRGPIYAWRIWVQNDDGTPQDDVAAKVTWRRDGVSI